MAARSSGALPVAMTIGSALAPMTTARSPGRNRDSARDARAFASSSLVAVGGDALSVAGANGPSETVRGSPSEASIGTEVSMMTANVRPTGIRRAIAGRARAVAASTAARICRMTRRCRRRNVSGLRAVSGAMARRHRKMLETSTRRLRGLSR